MDWQRIEKWDYIVVAVSAEYHKKYNMVELEDIKQSLYQWFVEHPHKLEEWESIGEKDAKNLIYRSLRNEALDYCNYWKAKTLGYELSDLFYYESDMVEVLLPAVIRGEMNITQKLNLGRPGRPSAPSEGGNLMVMLIEIDSAYQELDKDDKLILHMRYADAMDFDEMAIALSLASPDAARMRHKRAIKRIIKKVGGYKPFVDRDYTAPTEED
jgi:DNA-directed RNA polymerase specialized sigma24 family protein